MLWKQWRDRWRQRRQEKHKRNVAIAMMVLLAEESSGKAPPKDVQRFVNHTLKREIYQEN